MFQSLESLLHDQIKDLYNAENQLIKALPKLAKKASSETLRAAFEGHLEETRVHVERLAEAALMLEVKATGKTCKAMQGLIEEGKEVLDGHGEPSVIDAALIAAAQRVEHYEIAAYTSAHAMAEQLGEMKVVKLLQDTLDDELGAFEKLSDIFTREILPAATRDAEPTEKVAAPARRASR